MAPKKVGVNLQPGSKGHKKQRIVADAKHQTIRAAYLKDGSDAWLDIDVQDDGKGLGHTKYVSYWLKAPGDARKKRLARDQVDWTTIFDGKGYTLDWVTRRAVPEFEKRLPGVLSKRKTAAMNTVKARDKKRKANNKDDTDDESDSDDSTSKKKNKKKQKKHPDGAISAPQSPIEEDILLSKFEDKNRQISDLEIKFVCDLLQKRNGLGRPPSPDLVQTMKNHTLTGQGVYDCAKWLEFLERHGQKADEDHEELTGYADRMEDLGRKVDTLWEKLEDFRDILWS